METNYDQLLERLIRLVVKDFICDRDMEDVNQFFESAFFNSIMIHFGMDTEIFLGELQYYKLQLKKS